MFFSVFWTVYIPIVTIILSGLGDWLTHSLRQLRAHAASGSDGMPPMSRRFARTGGAAARSPSTREAEGRSRRLSPRSETACTHRFEKRSRKNSSLRW
jgi:hypothetical protein